MSTEAIDTKLAATMQEKNRWLLFTACVLVSLTNEISSAVTNLALVPMRCDLNAFRFYGPTESYFDKSWPLPDIEEVK
jgi:hypothetical protein